MIEEHLKQIKSEVDEIDRRIGGWNSLYQMIRTESIAHDFPCAAARSQANKMLNRYRDVSPFDHSRVVLTKGHLDYINASLVQVSRAGRRYILTQGPLPQTAGHFWLMVWEQNSSAILMLNKVIEKNQIKCHQYWPLGAINNDSDLMEFPDVDLRVRYISEERSRNFVVRTLRVEDMTTSESREVLQFHYTTWPDFGVPSTPRSFLHFLQVVRDSGVLNADVGPPIVHCSAGIGRSGTFCLVDSCLLMMEEGLTVNVKDVLMDMRKFRMGLIQTADQLRFSYLAILEGLQQLAEGKKRFMSDESENGQVDIEVDERPAPPKRTTSANPVLPNPLNEAYLRFIQEQQVERPLPEPPNSSSEEDSSEDSLLDDIDDDDDSAEKSESSSKEETVPAHKSGESHNSVNNVNENNSTKEKNSFVEPDEVTNISDVKTNGVTSTDEAALRRRAKNEALREKIKEIKAHQKEAEAVQGFYRSPKPKRRKESHEVEDVGADSDEVVADASFSSAASTSGSSSSNPVGGDGEETDNP